MANPTTLSSSPRLPSPPPFTENQIQPGHPVVDPEPLPVGSPRSTSFAHSNSTSSPTSSAPNHTAKDDASVRRIRPGTKSVDIATGPPLIPLGELDSAFQLQEHLSAILASTTSRPSGGLGTEDHTVSLSKSDCDAIATAPEGVDERLWCYELTRRLTRDLNILVVSLIRDGCTATSCPEMRADEWQYLCAAHDPPRSCCAIDYITHTLDNAAMILCSTKYFPSRLSLTSNGTKHLSSIFRRLYRIFAHAWFQHRDVFWEVEREYGLYLFFKTVSEHYGLIPEDNLTIPPEAEDIEAVIAKQKESEDFRPRGGNGTRTLEDFQSWSGEGGEDSDDSDGEGSDLDIDDKEVAENGDAKEHPAPALESDGNEKENGVESSHDTGDELKEESEELEEIPVAMLDLDTKKDPIIDDTEEAKGDIATEEAAGDNNLNADEAGPTELAEPIDSTVSTEPTDASEAVETTGDIPAEKEEARPEEVQPEHVTEPAETDAGDKDGDDGKQDKKEDKKDESELQEGKAVEADGGSKPETAAS